MTLMPPSAVDALAARYRVEHEVGAGGMATVYLAEDLKHHRRVALKVLKPELAAILGAERFLKEIEVTANLQHPNILPLYDSGEAAGYLYYVMPFIEGESLRARLTREKQLSVDEALRITDAVAAALQFAHERGVVHRDIKPENILLQAGQALVADFGIALAVSQASGTRLTETGLSLGTPHYMSPEQATGDRIIDARSDIYALGCVLYEMLAGEPPHLGNTVQAVVAKILTDDPEPVTKRRKTVPPHVDAAVRKALAKLPADRFASAAEMRMALGNAAFTVPVAAAQLASRRGWRSRIAVPMTVAAAVLALLAAAGWGRKTSEAPRTVVRFEVAPFQAAGRYVAGAVSPDGHDVMLVQVLGDRFSLVRRSLSGLETRQFDVGAERAGYPAFSPDGREVAWVSLVPGNTLVGRLRVTPIDGGPARTVADTTIATPSWGDDGYVYFSRPNTDSLTARILRVPAGGGSVDTVLGVDSMEFYQPRMLPGSRAGVAIARRHGASGQWKVIAFDAVGHSWQELTSSATSVAVTRAGDVLYTRGRYLMAARLDARKLAFAGRPFPVLEVSGNEFGWFAYGGRTLAYLSSSTSGTNEPVLVNRRGVVRRLPGLPALQAFGYPAVSPDGRKIAMKAIPTGAGEPQADLWIYELPSGPLTRLTTEPGPDDDPTWTADGKRILFDSERKGQNALWIVPWDGSGSAELVLDRQKNIYRTSWLPGGHEFLFEGDAPDGGGDIGIGVLGQPDSSRLLLTASFSEVAPVASPDGRWMAYQSDESGRPEIYVRPLKGEGTRRQISRQSGAYPRWAWSGRELFFTTGSGDSLMVARLDVQHDAAAQSVEALFPLRQSNVGYDVFPGDSLFVVFAPPASEGDQSHPAVVIHNFDAVLEASASATAKR
jgi:eukaryotic-like serine/threonine-protein kinase